MIQTFLEQGSRTAFTKNKKIIPFLTFFGGKSQEDEGQLHKHGSLPSLLCFMCNKAAEAACGPLYFTSVDKEDMEFCGSNSINIM